MHNTGNLNNTYCHYPRENALGSLISKQALKTPDKLAIKFKDLTLSYESLNAKSNQMAFLLIDNNIQIGDKIGLSLDRSIDMAISFLAILKAGAAYIPLDPHFPVDRLAYMLDDSQAKVLITSKKYENTLKTDVKKLFIEDLLLQLEHYPTSEPDVQVGGSDVAYILYTSGSTGKPKGVQIEHHNLVNLLLSIQKSPGLDENDILLSVTTISFDIFELELYLPLISGALLILAENEVAKDGRRILEILRKEKVTVMQATPYTWKMLLESGWEDSLPLKVFCGGEALTKKLVSGLLPKCGTIWNMYGPTETTIYSTIKLIESSDAIISIGRPIDNTQVYILNEALELQAEGDTGEIYIGGDGVGRGYLNNAELTEEKFISNPFTTSPGERLYRTGDLGKISSEQEIVCLGRVDHQIKIRGYRIETEEIEENLNKLSNIMESVVVAHTDSLENQRLVAYIVSKTEIDEDKVKNYKRLWNEGLKAVLPDYMLPHTYVSIPNFPITPNGKIDKKALPEPVFTSDLTDYMAPGNATEKMLEAIWTKYLGIKKISITDNFFALGGHSILAVQMMVQIEKQTGRRLPISVLFEFPTIQKIASLIDNGDNRATSKSLIRIKPGGNKVPLFIVHGIGLNVLIFNDFVNHLDPEQPVYGLQALGLNGADKPLENVEEIAAHYINEILEENPDGPFLIAGYSLGGYIALEMAKQLKLMEKEVKMLFMIDTNLKISDGESKPAIAIRKIRRQFPKLLFLIRSFLHRPSATLNYQSSIVKAKFRESLQKAGLIKVEQPENNIFDHMDVVAGKLLNAVNNYKVTPYDGKVFLMKAKERIYFIDDLKYLGWRKYALKGVVIDEVSGDHKMMLLPPFAKEFAGILQKRLDEAFLD